MADSGKAYMIVCNEKCYVGDCEERATYRVYNKWNWCMGRYCVEHAKRRVNKLNEVKETGEVNDG